MKTIEMLLDFLEKKSAGWGSLDMGGKLHYAKNADYLSDSIERAQKFELGNIDEWEGIKIDNETPVKLPYPIIFLEFYLPAKEESGRHVDFPCGALMLEEKEKVTAELFISPYSEHAAFVSSWYCTRDAHLFRMRIQKPKNPKKNAKFYKYGKEHYVEVQEAAYTVMASAITAVLLMNECLEMEKDGMALDQRLEAAEGKGGAVYKKLVVDMDKVGRSEHQGGTHASPRYHKRRGHWRHLSDGRKIWINQMDVGDKSNGEVIKDYVVKKPNFLQRIIDRIKSYKAVA